MEEKRKSTYNAEAQKKYNQKFKNISCKVSIEEYNKIKQHAESKGFKSLNAYVIGLISKDMNN